MKNPLIVALDVPTLDEAAALAKSIGDAAGMFKIGLEQWAVAGPDSVRAIDGPVFLDLKLHDIPTTVARALAALKAVSPAMVNVHALGGRAMMEAAADAKPHPTKLLAVTILTSLDDEALHELGLPRASKAVPHLAQMAVAAGCDGIVCSPADLDLVTPIVPEGFLLVTPGVRSPGQSAYDQARTLSPREAIAQGATHIVVGRPITRAADPRSAALAIVEEVAG